MVPIRIRPPFAIASLLCLPLLVFLMLFLILMALIAANVRFPYYFYMPGLLGMYWLVTSPIMSFIWLSLASTSVVMAWFQKGKTRFEIVCTVICSVVVLLYVGLVHWFLTKPR